MRAFPILFRILVVICPYAPVSLAGGGTGQMDSPDSIVTLSQLTDQALQTNPALQASRASNSGRRGPYFAGNGLG